MHPKKDIDSIQPWFRAMKDMFSQSRDFWLEGHRMGDWRRHPTLVPNILQPGDNYYKPEVGQGSNQTCMPLPFAERNANPNMGP